MKYSQNITYLKQNYKQYLTSSFLFIFTIYLMLTIPKQINPSKTSSLNDIILNFLPTINLNFLFSIGFIIIILTLIISTLLLEFKNILYFLTQISFLLILRQIFIYITQIKISPLAIQQSYPGFLNFFQFENDLFFSGHVAVPFLAFLFFYNSNKYLKYFFLSSSIFMGFIVLLMKVHYSIDVFAAPFITYSSFKLIEKIYKKNQK